MNNKYTFLHARIPKKVRLISSSAEYVIDSWRSWMTDSKLLADEPVRFTFVLNPKSRSISAANSIMRDRSRYIADTELGRVLDPNHYDLWADNVVRRNPILSDLRVVKFAKSFLKRGDSGVHVYSKTFNRVFPFSADVLLDCMLNNGIGKNGKLKGDFTWAIVNHRCFPVKLGSDYYKAIIESIEERNSRIIKMPTMKFGEVYHTGSKYFIFLGSYDVNLFRCSRTILELTNGTRVFGVSPLERITSPGKLIFQDDLDRNRFREAGKSQLISERFKAYLDNTANRCLYNSLQWKTGNRQELVKIGQIDMSQEDFWNRLRSRLTTTMRCVSDKFMDGTSFPPDSELDTFLFKLCAVSRLGGTQLDGRFLIPEYNELVSYFNEGIDHSQQVDTGRIEKFGGMFDVAPKHEIFGDINEILPC